MIAADRPAGQAGLEVEIRDAIAPTGRNDFNVVEQALAFLE